MRRNVSDPWAMLERVQKCRTKAGHKCLGAVMSFHVNCECGWTSGNHSGPKARQQAYLEWRSHIAETH